MRLALPEGMDKRLNQISERKSMKKEEIIMKALRCYLSLSAEDLESEFKAWDRLSDEALITFEKRLEV